ncbi:hypothetical protein F5Y17DRAFT_433279 [Xylariaceae sp. FL0594]|nr:hypothetical protein F5Y17DRAFT_433279 [Xylariaceae sp. FL0594]
MIMYKHAILSRLLTWYTFAMQLTARGVFEEKPSFNPHPNKPPGSRRRTHSLKSQFPKANSVRRLQTRSTKRSEDIYCSRTRFPSGCQNEGQRR